MKVESDPLAFVFEDRTDVVRELLHGSHAHNMRAHECSNCGLLHALVTSPMLTPFSGKQRVPAGVMIAVEIDWSLEARQRSAPRCAACELTMTPVEEMKPG